MSGVRMIQDNTETCLRNLERSLSHCNTFLQHRCIPSECARATKVTHPAPGHTPEGKPRRICPCNFFCVADNGCLLKGFAVL